MSEHLISTKLHSQVLFKLNTSHFIGIKRNDDHFDLQEKLLMIIRTPQLLYESSSTCFEREINLEHLISTKRSDLLFKLIRSICCHQKARVIILMFTKAFHDNSQTIIYCLSRTQHARCEEFTVSISFPQNARENFCSTLLDHLVVI